MHHLVAGTSPPQRLADLTALAQALRLDREVLERILEKAQRSASGGNTQPWHGIVLTGDPLQGLIERVAQDVPKGSKAFAPEYHVYPPEL